VKPHPRIINHHAGVQPTPFPKIFPGAQSSQSAQPTTKPSSFTFRKNEIFFDRSNFPGVLTLAESMAPVSGNNWYPIVIKRHSVSQLGSIVMTMRSMSDSGPASPRAYKPNRTTWHRESPKASLIRETYREIASSTTRFVRIICSLLTIS